MRSKKLLLFAFTLILLSMAFISADLQCTIESAVCDPGYNSILGLSGATNAHGAIAGGYESNICCNFELGDSICGDGNEHKIIGLSSETNAHAEITGNSLSAEYVENVCYESFSGCRTLAEGETTCNYNSGEIEVVSLSSETNAHIGAFNNQNYNTKICCKVTAASWADSEQKTTISSTSVQPGITKVLIVGKNVGSSAIVTIFNDDFGSDTEIASFNVEADEFGNIEQPWTISQDALDLAKGQDSEFYAIITPSNGKGTAQIKSNVLTIGEISNPGDCIEKEIKVCSDYKTQADCTANPICPVAHDDSFNCGNILPIEGELQSDCFYYISCYCSWNSKGGTDGNGDGVSDGICESASQETLQQVGNKCQKQGVEVSTNFNAESVINGNSGDKFTTSGTITAQSIVTLMSSVGGVITFSNGSITAVIPNSQFILLEGDTFTPNEGETATLEFLTSGIFITDLGGTFTTFTTYPSSLGKCSIQETSSDTCDDGFITYQWNAIWDWMNNVYDSSPGQGFEVGEDGKYHFPTDKYSKCKSKERTIPCPAQIQLPFFTWVNFLVALVIIGLIYFLYLHRNNSKKQRKSQKRK